MTQEEGIVLERHEGRLLLLEREMKELRSVQKEIRAMNESLVVLTNELRHTNEHMKSHGKRLGELERAPRRAPARGHLRRRGEELGAYLAKCKKTNS